MATKDAEKLKKEEKEVKKKKMTTAAKAYRTIRHENKAAEQSIGANQNKSKGFLDGYSQVIDSYIDTFGNEEQTDNNIKKLLDDYYKFYPLKRPPFILPPLSFSLSKGKDASEKDKQEKKDKEQKKHEEAMASDKKKKPYEVQSGVRDSVNAALADTDLMQADIGEKDSDIASKGIRSDAMKGLTDISQWMLRNCVKTGVAGDSKTDFVTSYILKQPARVKLFAYYLVETDKRKETEPEALKEALYTSQMDYAPNLELFKNKMIASKFKIWKRINADQFYWDKLAQSMRYAVANINFILPFGAMNVHEETGGVQKAKEQASVPEGAEQGSASGQSGQPAAQGGKDKQMTEIELLEKERQADFDDFMNSGRELIKLKQKREKSKSAAAVSYQEILMLANRMHSAYDRMEGADKAVAAALQQFYESKGLKGEVQRNDVDDDKTTKAGTYSGYAGTVVQLGGTVTRNLDKMADGYNTLSDFIKNHASWNIGKIPQGFIDQLGNLHDAGDIVKIVGPAISLISVVLNSIDLAKHGSQMTAGMKAMRGLDIMSNVSSAATTVTNAAMSLAGVGETAANIAGGTLGAVTGGLNMVTGVTSFFSARSQKSDLSQASDNIMINRQNTLSEKERRKAENTAKLGERLANTRQANAVIKTISGGLQLVGGILTATGVGAVVGTAIGTAGTLLNMTTYAVSYYRKRKNIVQTIDDYINMNKMVDIVYRSLTSNTAQSAKEFFRNEDKIKDQLRKEAVARLGYPSKESLYNAIIYEYATNLYNHIFYVDGDPSKGFVKDEKDVDKDYLLLLNGLGLKIEFSSKKPHISYIAKRLRNV